MSAPIVPPAMLDTCEDRLMVLAEIEQRVRWLATAIIDHANRVRPNPTGLKVGGHQASSASMTTLMTALWFEHLRSGDRVSVKPHASPVLHAINYLLGELDESYLTTLREFGGLQSYPSRSKDPDPVDYSTGSVGIGATAPIWGAVARRYVTTLMRLATLAVTTGDIRLAEQVITAGPELGSAGNSCEDHAQRLLALQSPVAGDLRTILAALYCAVKIERMGDLSAHLAGLVRYSHPEPAVHDEVADTVNALGELTVTMASRLQELTTGAALASFSWMNSTDDAVDALCTRLMSVVRSDEWRHGVPAAVNLALLVRFYERFADQAVSVARRLEFATTGTLPG